MQSITHLSAIVAPYDALLVDLWGVIHDGSALYPGAKECLIQLKESGKRVIFISNAPRRAAKAEVVLRQLGISADLHECTVTSGEVGFHWLSSYPFDNSLPLEGGGSGRGCGASSMSDVAEDSHPHPDLPPSRGKGKVSRHYFFIGPDRDADVLDGLEYQRVNSPEEADFLLNVGFGTEAQSEDAWTDILMRAAAQKLPMVCLNPDREVVKITGERYACAGVIAEDYVRMGGKVHWFGKPYPAVYARCFELLHPVDKSRILAIGDGLHTDIAGARGAGIASLLITGGILQGANAPDFQGKEPDFIASALVW